MSFADYLAKCWDEHANDPEAVASRLGEGLSLVQEPGQLAKLVQLAVHVLGEHLGHFDDGIQLFEEWTTTSPVKDAADMRALQRGMATLHYCAGRGGAFEAALTVCRDESQPAGSDRVRVLAAAAGALAGQGRIDEAAKAFEEALQEAGYGPDKSDPAALALAMTGNNLSWELEEKLTRHPERSPRHPERSPRHPERSEGPQQTTPETALMIKAAEVSRRFWEIAGSWLEVERAEHRVSRSLSAAGKGEAAVRHAEECLRLCAENDADAFERFFGYEALARAHRANGDKAAAQAARDQAAKYADRVGDDLKSYCLECLEQLS